MTSVVYRPLAAIDLARGGLRPERPFVLEADVPRGLPWRTAVAVQVASDGSAFSSCLSFRLAHSTWLFVRTRWYAGQAANLPPGVRLRTSS